MRRRPCAATNRNEAGQPAFRGGINFVRVDVIISDKNGNNIADLKESDFEVTEDGKPQTVESFKFIKLDGGTMPGPDGPPRQIRTDEDEEAEAARDDVRLFAVFLDDYHVRRLASMGVRDPLTKFIETQLGPSDMIGLMYPLQSVLNVRMTRNHAAIVQGIQKFMGRKYDYTPMNDIEQQYANYPTETVERIRNKVSLSALKGLIIHMGTLKQGRKSLIVVSEGFTYMVPPQMRSPNSQMPAIAGVTGGAADPVTESRANFSATIDMQQDLRDIYDEANRNNVSLYPVDPRGLAVFEFDLASRLSATMQDRRTERHDGFAANAGRTRRPRHREPQRSATGMKQIIRGSSAYYLLGYSSTAAPSDGKFHKIRSREASGLQVRAQGYRALTAEKRPGPGAAKPARRRRDRRAVNVASATTRARRRA